MTPEEKEARDRALADARVREAEERKRQEAEAGRRRDHEERERKEREAAARRKAEDDARHRVEEEGRKKAEEAAKKLPVQRAPQVADEDEAPLKARLGVKREIKVPAPTRTKGDAEKRRGKLTLANALEDGDDRARSIAAFRRRTERQKKQAQGFQMPTEKMVREVTMPEAITIQELANRMAERAVDLIKLLMKQGQMHTINDVIDADTAQIIAEEMGHKVQRVAEADVVEGLSGDADAAECDETACARRHHHGPCRSRQDVATRCDPQDQCGCGRGGRHHPAYRRLSGRDDERACDLHRHARP